VKNGIDGSYAVVIGLPILDEFSNLIYEMKRYYVEVFNQTPSSNWTNWTRDGKGQKMTSSSTSSSNCRRIYFAAQEFSNWVTENNSDITKVRYILFYDERMGPGVEEILPFTRLYDCGTEATLSSNFIIPKAPGSIKVEKNYRGVITTELDD
jgi:hypothetical protein